MISLKTKKKIIYAVILSVLFIIEASPLNFFKINGITPEFILPCIILIAMFEDEKYAAIFGLVFGLIFDMQSKIIGFNALFFMILGYAIGLLMHALIRRNIFSVFTFILTGVLLHNLLTYLLFFAYKSNGDFSFAFASIIIPKTIFSTAFGLLLYFGFNQLKLKIINKE